MNSHRRYQPEAHQLRIRSHSEDRRRHQLRGKDRDSGCAGGTLSEKRLTGPTASEESQQTALPTSARRQFEEADKEASGSEVEHHMGEAKYNTSF